MALTKFNDYRIYRTITLLGGVLIMLGVFAAMVRGDRDRSNSEKRKIVYQMYTGYQKDFPDVGDISPQQAMELLKQERVIFVDTRKPAEMAVSMLPGAVSKKDFLSQPEQHRDKTAVAYCTISYRSGKFASQMAAKGITLLNLRGGILAWTLEGGRVYDPSGKEVKRIHVYGDTWDYAPAGYESVKF